MSKSRMNYKYGEDDVDHKTVTKVVSLKSLDQKNKKVQVQQRKNVQFINRSISIIHHRF